MDTLKFTIEYLEDEHEEILAFCNRMEEKCLEILNGQVDVEFFRKAIKKQDSPWDADLTGSVASTVGTKVTYLFISVKYLLDFVN